MKWLYPNFLRKIDHYLKTNYPHIWRTRVHDFGWFSLLLGNAVAASFAILIVGADNVLSRGSTATMHGGLAMMLGFVGLFWAIRLMRFKIKFSNFKTMLTTWVIYVLCLASLGLNLATFTSTIAYKTAYLYSDKMVQADHDYMDSNFNYHQHSDGYYLSPYMESDVCFSCLKKEHKTDELMAILSRHGFDYSADNKIRTYDIEAVKDRIYILKEAKVFVWQPILGTDYDNHDKRSFYHELLQMNWGMGMFLLLFLPTLLFLVSVFGLRNVLISGFCTALIAGVTAIAIDVLDVFRYNQEEYLFTIYAFIAFTLGMTLAIGRHRLQSWNYIAGIFMLMLGVVFFTSFIVTVENMGFPKRNVLWIIGSVSFVSLTVSLIAAWMIAKRSEQPVLR